MRDKWQLESEGCVLECEGTKVRLRALDPVHSPRPTNTAALSPFALHEWADYRVVVESSIADRVSVWVNQQRLRRDPDGPFWSCMFQNQIGKSVIQVALDGRPLPPLTVEVLSNKFSSLAEQHAFYQALLDELWQRNSRLPFSFAAPTIHAVEEAPQPPSAPNTWPRNE